MNRLMRIVDRSLISKSKHILPIVGFLLILAYFVSEFKVSNDVSNSEVAMDEREEKIGREEALRIANEDAARMYRDLSIYHIQAELRNDKWYVDYEISNPQMVGGGPHYVISARTGEVLSFRYEQ